MFIVKKISLRAIDWCTIYFLLGLIFIVNCLNVDFTVNPDLRFLYNRALQMYNCISEGNIPYFYYNDFGGVGYGSAFFYGHLTLYPFLPFVKLGLDKFLLIYSSVTILLTYLGSLTLAKRFTSNYKFISLIYIGSCFTLQMFYTTGTYANNFGVALSFFFLAYCIDFFRDNKSFIKATLLFYLIINTHLITSLLSFLVCCLLLIVYFDKNRLKDYIKFAIITCLVCSYFILNFFYHSDILTSTTKINETMLTYAQNSNSNVIGNYMSNTPYLGTIDLIILSLLNVDLSVSGFRIFNLVTIFFLVLYLLKRRKSLSKKEFCAIIIVMVLTIISERSIWLGLNKICLIPFQFPTRYMHYCILCTLIVCFRYLDSRKVKSILFIFSCCDLILISAMTNKLTDTSHYTDLFCQVENGEYLDESFTWDTNEFYYLSSHVVGDDNVEYSYSLNENILFIDYNGNSSNITIPKLYYKGYAAETNDGVVLPIAKGYSQFINIDVSNIDNCTIVVQYKHPLLFVILDLLCNCMVLVLFWNNVYKNYKKSK